MLKKSVEKSNVLKTVLTPLRHLLANLPVEPFSLISEVCFLTTNQKIVFLRILNFSSTLIWKKE